MKALVCHCPRVGDLCVLWIRLSKHLAGVDRVTILAHERKGGVHHDLLSEKPFMDGRLNRRDINAVPVNRGHGCHFLDGGMLQDPASMQLIEIILVQIVVLRESLQRLLGVLWLALAHAKSPGKLKNAHTSAANTARACISASSC